MKDEKNGCSASPGPAPEPAAGACPSGLPPEQLIAEEGMPLELLVRVVGPRGPVTLDSDEVREALCPHLTNRELLRFIRLCERFCADPFADDVRVTKFGVEVARARFTTQFLIARCACAEDPPVNYEAFFVDCRENALQLLTAQYEIGGAEGYVETKSGLQTRVRVPAPSGLAQQPREAADTLLRTALRQALAQSCPAVCPSADEYVLGTDGAPGLPDETPATNRQKLAVAARLAVMTRARRDPARARPRQPRPGPPPPGSPRLPPLAASPRHHRADGGAQQPAPGDGNAPPGPARPR